MCMGTSCLSVAPLGILNPPQQFMRREPFPGQHFPHYLVDQRPRVRDIFLPKPVADSTEWPPPPGTGCRDEASPPRCGSRTNLRPHRLRLEPRFYTPPGSSHICRDLQESISEATASVGQSRGPKYP